MSPYQLPTVNEGLILKYLRDGKWCDQQKIIKWRAKDNRFTRLILQNMQQKGLLKSRYTLTEMGATKRQWKIRYTNG